MSYRAAVITVSDRTSAGTRSDASGPIAVAALREAGFECGEPIVVPDGADSVERALRDALADGARLIVTSGGTGVGPRDATPEGTARVLTREVPGIAEELRRRGAVEMPAGMLTRGLAGVVDGVGALIVNLPGSPGGVASGIPVVVSVARHVLDQLGGGDH
ncbi:MogA/MoaB family molybdenum cofactor biosynthesis protein [Microbacterium sp. P5_E9]